MASKGQGGGEEGGGGKNGAGWLDLDALHHSSIKGPALVSFKAVALQPGVLQGFLSCWPALGVPAPSPAFKVHITLPRVTGNADDGQMLALTARVHV